jgi:hypothetical protein
MDEPKKSTPSAADIGSEAHTGIPNAGNVTPGTTPNAADLTENELEGVVGGGLRDSGTLGSQGDDKTAKTVGGK